MIPTASSAMARELQPPLAPFSPSPVHAAHKNSALGTPVDAVVALHALSLSGGRCGLELSPTFLRVAQVEDVDAVGSVKVRKRRVEPPVQLAAKLFEDRLVAGLRDEAHDGQALVVDRQAAVLNPRKSRLSRHDSSRRGTKRELRV